MSKQKSTGTFLHGRENVQILLGRVNGGVVVRLRTLPLQHFGCFLGVAGEEGIEQLLEQLLAQDHNVRGGKFQLNNDALEMQK